MRLLARKLYYWPQDLLSVKNDLIPPKGLIYTGRGDFLKVGKFWAEKFVKEGGLKSSHHVLDIGSGIGRMAVGLTPIITDGQYEGFDAVQQGVDWCNKNIKTKFPNFNFTYVDLNNDLYKSKGIDASKYTFEYPENKFDFAISISVFTHMLPEEVSNYLEQTNKVLRKGGILMSTFFIVDNLYKSAGKGFHFPFDYGHYLLMDDEVKSANVAFRLEYLTKLCETSGFKIKSFVPGYWQESVPQLDNDFQDYLILEKL